jgi:hypothetical protein
MKRSDPPPLPSPPTYPAKPSNGGRLELAEEKDPEEWRYRAKYNGRRVLLHLPTMRTWNKELEENNWVFPAFKKLQLQIGLRWPQFEWMDLELLYGKTSIFKRSIVVLDYVSNEPWWDRMMHLQEVFAENSNRYFTELKDDQVFFARPFGKTPIDVIKAWVDTQEFNKKLGCTFFEGLVAYEMRAPYPVQLFSPTRKTHHWMKHRFIN